MTGPIPRRREWPWRCFLIFHVAYPYPDYPPPSKCQWQRVFSDLLGGLQRRPRDVCTVDLALVATGQHVASYTQRLVQHRPPLLHILRTRAPRSRRKVGRKTSTQTRWEDTRNGSTRVQDVLRPRPPKPLVFPSRPDAAVAPPWSARPAHRIRCTCGAQQPIGKICMHNPLDHCL